MTLIETLISLGFKDATVVSEQNHTFVVRMTTTQGSVYERFGKDAGEAQARAWANGKVPK